jgi:hypothetical protein
MKSGGKRPCKIKTLPELKSKPKLPRPLRGTAYAGYNMQLTKSLRMLTITRNLCAFFLQKTTR